MVAKKYKFWIYILFIAAAILIAIFIQLRRDQKITNLEPLNQNMNTQSNQKSDLSIDLHQDSGLQWHISTPTYPGGALTVISGFTGPYGLTITKEGVLYVPDLKEGRVIRLTKDLRFDGWVGLAEGNPPNPSGWHYSGGVVRGDKYGSMQMPHSVDFSSTGEMFVADYLNDRIAKYDQDANFLGYFFDEPTDQTLKFFGPPSALFDQKNNLWISDFDGNRIFKFDSQLTFLGWLGANKDGSLTKGWQTTGEPGATSLPGGFNQPVSLFITDNDEMLIADNGNNRIEKFSLDGTFLGWLGGKKDQGVTAGWETTGLSTIGTIPGSFDAPFDARVYKNKLYTADGHNGRIQIFTLN